MNNPLKTLINQSKIKPYQVADRIGMNRNKIYRALSRPATTKLETLDQIARYFGYRIEIRLVKEANDDPETN